MEQVRLEELVEESIALELNAAELYRLFSQAHPADESFWWQLHLEEKSHARLMRAARDSFLKRGAFPYDLLDDSLELIKHTNERIRKLIARFIEKKPGRRQACETAIALENESGENHFNAFMHTEAHNAVESVFHQLNGNDTDHALRIREYLDTLPAEA